MPYCGLMRREPPGAPFAPYGLKEGSRVVCRPLQLPVGSTLAGRWAAFNIVGAIGVIVQVAAFACLVRVCHWHYLSATAAAVEAAVVHNFVWHQCWTWSHRPARSPRVVAARFLQFQLLNGGISLAGNLALMRLLTGALGVDPIPANIAAICLCASLNFAASELIVFRAALPVLLAVVVASAPAALNAQSQAALAGWDEYQACVDARYRSATPGGTFFIHDREGHAGWRDAVRDGSVAVTPIDTPAIADGKLHHWVGAVFLPGTTVGALVARLEAAAGHESESYSDVIASKLLAHDGDRLRVFLKLRRSRSSPSPTTASTRSIPPHRRGPRIRAQCRNPDRGAGGPGNAARTRKGGKGRQRIPVAPQRLLAIRGVEWRRARGMRVGEPESSRAAAAPSDREPDRRSHRA